MRGYLVTATKNKNIVHLWIRTEDNRKVKVIVHGFRPYFYILSELGDYKSIFGETLDKIVLEDPSDVPKYREKYDKTYEADIPYVRRFVIDKGIYTCVEVVGNGSSEVSVDQKFVRPCNYTTAKPWVWYLDIEVYAKYMPNAEHPVNPIIAISIYDNRRNKYITWAWHKNFRNTTLNAKYYEVSWEVRTFEEEELMLMDFVSELVKIKPDIIAGWNIYFDKDYLIARLRYLKILNTIDFVDWFDLLNADKNIVKNRRGRKLKHVTVEEGLETREEAKEASDILPLWEDNPIEVIKYNVRDVWRIVKLDEKYKYIDTYLAYKEVTGHIHLDDTLSMLKLVDIVVLRTAKELGVALPTAVSKGKYSRYKGGFVLTPPKGIVENIAVLDMSKYYPMLIISFNISPEKKWKLIDKVNRIWLFKQDSPGIIPQSVIRVVSVEEALRKEQQKYKPDDPMYEVLERKIMATKGVRNSFYGVMANENFRLFDPDCAATITGLGREGIMYAANYVRSKGYKVVYQDTDSIFIQVPFDKADKMAEEISEAVRKYFKEKYNLKSDPQIHLKFEKYYKRMLFTGRKKRYAGWLVWKKGKETDKIDIVGFEAVRSDTAPFTGEAEHRIMEIILREGVNYDKLNEAVSQLMKEAKERPLDEIALYSSISKPLDEYKTKPPHIRAAIYSNMYLGTSYGNGSKVKYVWVKSVKGLPPTDVIAFETEEQVRDKIVIDWDKQLRRILIDPLERIFEAIGYKYGMSTRTWW